MTIALDSNWTPHDLSLPAGGVLRLYRRLGLSLNDCDTFLEAHLTAVVAEGGALLRWWDIPSEGTPVLLPGGITAYRSAPSEPELLYAPNCPF